MANFDPNKWYQIVKSKETILSMDGSYLYADDHNKGSAFLQITDTTKPEQQWQFFPYGSLSYVLRTKGSGPNGCLTTSASVNETTPGGTVMGMTNTSMADSSMFWQVTPWGDGTFFLTNSANGSEWHAFAKPDALMAMSSNLTQGQSGQQFSFNPIGPIQDKGFSTLNTYRYTTATSSTFSLPNSTPTSAMTSVSSAMTSVSSATTSVSSATTSVSSSTPSAPPVTTFVPSATTSAPSATSSSTSNSTGLSVGASAAIGASIGGGALILVLIGFFFWRRRKNLPIDSSEKSNSPYFSALKNPGSQYPRAELSAGPVGAELPVEAMPSEMEANLYYSTPVSGTLDDQVKLGHA